MRQSLGLFLTALASPLPAYAGVVLGVDNHFSHTLGDASTVGTGLGGSLGLGADLALFELRPEVDVSWYGPTRRVLPRAGARLMFGKMIEPGLYAHVVFADGLSLAPGRAGFDAGLALDLTTIPRFDIGLHAGVLGLPGANARVEHTLQSGLHLALHF